MKSNSIIGELTDLERQRDILNNQLDKKIGEFVDQLPSVAGQWIENETRRRIEDNPEHSQTMGAKRLSELKKKMKSLIDQLPEICKGEASNKDAWPHHATEEDHPSNQVKEGYFNSVFRGVINNLGAILDEYGLIVEKAGHYPSWKKEFNGKYRYQINPMLDTTKVPAIQEYIVIKKEHDKLNSMIIKKRKELEKEKASELWDSV